MKELIMWNIGQLERLLVHQAKLKGLTFIESVDLAACHVANLRGTLEWGEDWLPYLKSFDYSLIFLPNECTFINALTYNLLKGRYLC